ncbi:tyrosyl-DNA phosphodiesterase I, partial [Blyttiomyces helicus]
LGTHHTKAMILMYRSPDSKRQCDTLRVVIHTANMVSRDWENRTQGVWLSPRIHRKSSSSTPASAFETDLLAYLSAYDGALSSWCSDLAGFDFSRCKAVLVASVPGRHVGSERHRWGLARLARELARVECASSGVRETIVCQVSSIGALGTADKWLQTELGTSLRSARNVLQCRRPDLRLVFPTVEDVRTSIDGWASGGSIPFKSDNWDKQESYMRPLLCSWRAEKAGRKHASPHIKTYARISETGTLSWFLVTSSNLSKAAWGAVQKNGAQLEIKSFELGVLVHPELW